MKEIEVKIIDIDADSIVKLLSKLGAKKVFEGPLETVYLEFDDSSVKGMNKKGTMLRIRKKGEHCIITYKERIKDADAKICDEYEVETEDFEKTRLIFRELGYKEYATDFHTRTSYRIMNSLVEFNFYDAIPPYLEVESPDKTELRKIVELLGFRMSDTNTWTGKELLDHYAARKGSPMSNRRKK